MSKLILYVALSVDGYIADADGGVDWLPQGEGGEDYGYYDFYEGIATTIMGSATYEQVLGFGPFPYPDKRNIVFSSRSIQVIPEVEVVAKDAIEYTKSLKAKDEGDIWLVGGASLADSLIKADLVDDYILTIIPVLLGKGIRLFEKDFELQKLKLKESRSYEDGLAQLHYFRES